MKMCMGPLEFIKDYAKNRVHGLDFKCLCIYPNKKHVGVYLHSKHLWKKEVAYVVDLAVNEGFFS